ncbi:MAG TPA: hypothetical protein DCP71_00545 [Verrucomicrobiales bacterium]|nr:hypothetical protein [Verrucomicrobiales bacterium]
MIDQTLYDAFGQRQVATIYSSATQYKVVLEVQPAFQSDPTSLARLYIPGPNGVQVPLSTVARFTNKVAPLTVNHQGQFPAVTISFNLAPGIALGQAVEKIQALQAELHTPITLDGSFQGTAQAFQSSLSSTPLLIAAAIIGDNLNYWIGRKAGTWMVTQKWFKRDYLSKTEAFFVKHGGKAIILARFVPIVRTFAPFTAGFGQMQYSRFLSYSLGGGFIWVLSFTLAGYFLGSIPFIKNNLKLVFVLIIFVSVLPIVIEVLKHKLAAKKEPKE